MPLRQKASLVSQKAPVLSGPWARAAFSVGFHLPLCSETRAAA